MRGQEGYTPGQVALLKSDMPLANKIRFFGMDIEDAFDVAHDGATVPAAPPSPPTPKSGATKGKKAKKAKKGAGEEAPKSAAA